ncbi:MAG TPA: DUF1328 family protein [Isosphaeraceae bacterium]|jgi:uncharacterized membrane protein YtjA (UPF0391 family)|nr:DUF1328 family protein [Isosphaeraceae bacterium]
MSILWWALILFLAALVAGGLGFTRTEGGLMTVSRTLFGVFLVLALVILVLALLGIGAVA